MSAVRYMPAGKSNTFNKGNCMAKNDPIINDKVASISASETSCVETELPVAPTALRKPISPLLLLMLDHSTPNRPRATLIIRKQATIESMIIGTKAK